MKTISESFNLSLNHDRLCQLGALVEFNNFGVTIKTKNNEWSYPVNTREYAKIQAIMHYEDSMFDCAKEF